ncbi:energy-coupling factor transporter transmembrane component T [Brevibacterium celere]|uniref:energy-coupling factor transporter transmembrane component T family protein n=1 Tax=Brevibacterium celere TaxID=225845 RepID=UPI0031E12B51
MTTAIPESRTRWHPATDLIVMACALFLVFGIPSPVVPAAVILGTLIAAVATRRVSLTRWALTVAGLSLPLLIVVGLVQGLFYPGTAVTVLWQSGAVRVTVEGLAIAAQIWLRVTALIALGALLGLGNDSAQLFDGLIALRLPAAVAYICASALSLIPLVRRRTTDVLDALAARGWPTHRWGTRIRLLPRIVAGLFTSLLVGVDQRHEVLDQRGFARSDHAVDLQDHRDDRVQSLIRRGGPLLTVALIVTSVAGFLPLPSADTILGGRG